MAAHTSWGSIRGPYSRALKLKELLPPRSVTLYCTHCGPFCLTYRCTLRSSLLSSARFLLSLMLSQCSGVRSVSAVHTTSFLLFRGVKWTRINFWLQTPLSFKLLGCKAMCEIDLAKSFMGMWSNKMQRMQGGNHVAVCIYSQIFHIARAENVIKTFFCSMSAFAKGYQDTV